VARYETRQVSTGNTPGEGQGTLGTEGHRTDFPVATLVDEKGQVQAQTVTG